MADVKKLKYVDRRPIYFPRLKYYPGGIALPNTDNIIKVSEQEARDLLKRTNGVNPCFEETKGVKKSNVVEIPEIKEDNNGSR